MKKTLFLLCFTAFCISINAAEEQTVLKPGTEAPTFSLPSMSGKRVALRTWSGDTLNKPHINQVPHTVIISFWATYCKPCQKEIPELMAFMKKHEKEPVKTFCISIDKEGAAIVKPFIKEKKYTLPVLLDPYQRTAQRYGVKSVPALFVIDPAGTIRYSSIGFDEKMNLDDKLEKIYEKIKSGAAAESGDVEQGGESVDAEAAKDDAEAVSGDTAMSEAEEAEDAALESTAPAETAKKESSLIKPGDEAPSFSLPSLDGNREALRVWTGDKLSKPHVNDEKHLVILSFWATYCKPCKKEIPELMAFAKKHKEKKIKIFLISIDKEGAEIVKPFIEKNKYTLPVLLDPYSRTAERYGVRSVPALFVIGPDGNVGYSATGFSEDTDLVALLDKIAGDLLAGKKVGPGESHVIGEAVDVEESDSSAVVTSKSQDLGAKVRWQAIVRVECGESLDAVAEDLGVTSEQIRLWYKELKKTLLDLWEPNREATE